MEDRGCCSGEQNSFQQNKKPSSNFATNLLRGVVATIFTLLYWFVIMMMGAIAVANQSFFLIFVVFFLSLPGSLLGYLFFFAFNPLLCSLVTFITQTIFILWIGYRFVASAILKKKN